MAQHSPKPEWKYAETLERINNISDPVHRQYARISYVSGGRLREVMDLKPKNVTVDWGKVILVIHTSKHTHTNSESGNIYGQKWETRQLPISKKYEPTYAQALIDLMNNEDKDATIRDILGGINDRQVQRFTRKELDIHPHNFRHLRARHLGKTRVPGQKPFSMGDLMYYFGWKNHRTALYYLEASSYEDIEEKTE